jgi:alkylation response protein AidB-like acyl-CoA dehydrogenase
MSCTTTPSKSSAATLARFFEHYQGAGTERLLQGWAPTLDFLLYDWLRADTLSSRARFADHSRETFDAVLDTCERIAREKYAPFNRLVDTQEPHFDGERVVLPQATHDAQKAYAESGMLSAAQDYDIGGMQLPYTVEAAANAFFAMASVSIGSGMLSVGNANLLMTHGLELQKKVFRAQRVLGPLVGHHVPVRAAGRLVAERPRNARRAGWRGLRNRPTGPALPPQGNKMWISSPANTS